MLTNLILLCLLFRKQSSFRGLIYIFPLITLLLYVQCSLEFLVRYFYCSGAEVNNPICLYVHRMLQLLDPTIEYYLVFEYFFRLDSDLITFPSNHLALFHRILGQLRNCLYKTHHIIFVHSSCWHVCSRYKTFGI